MPPKAVVLLSGGMDSATGLAIAKHDGFDVIALTFDYGQRHRKEIEAAKRVAIHFLVKDHRIATLDLRQIGGSALTNRHIGVPQQRSLEEIGKGIPPTYVPARNTILLSYALGLAEATGSQAIYIAANALDYSVHGRSMVWVRTPRWKRLMPVQDFCNMPEDDYRTISLNPRTLRLEWRRVTGRFRHPAASKRCQMVRLERGQEITVTEDHSLFTVDPRTAHLVPVKGAEIRKGMPLVVPFDLSEVASPWSNDLKSLDLQKLERFFRGPPRRWSIVRDDGHLTNRLRRTRIPVSFPLTDNFLYIIGLWLAEGGKEAGSRNPTLAFSVGSIPKAVLTLSTYFGSFGVNVAGSPANPYDYSVHSSVFAALFEYLGLFATSRGGSKAFPSFFWDLSQRQRRIMLAGLWDGDGSHVFSGQGTLAQKSHALIRDMYHCLTLDGIFPMVKDCRHYQQEVVIGRAIDFRRFVERYPLRHRSKLLAFESAGAVRGREQATGLWKCPGLWTEVARARLAPGEKTRVYNHGGKYNTAVRAQRSAFGSVEPLKNLVASKLAFLRVEAIEETREKWMYDLSVAGTENFVANGILAHNSGYPDCRPEFYAAFQEVGRLGTKRGVEGHAIEICTPLIRMSKADIVRAGEELRVPWALTWSCYLGGAKACGVCDSCQLRLKGFREAGIEDPIPYATRRPTNA